VNHHDERLDAYLWDPAAPPEDSVVEIERRLAPARFDPRAHPLASSDVPRTHSAARRRVGSWLPPMALAAAALVIVWVLVGTGAGMLAGTVFRTPEQASAIGPALGIGLGMLGGAMWPLEIVTPVMRAIGHGTPHAWAVDGWIEVLSRGGGLLDIGPQLAVLAGFAAVLLALASIRLRRRLTA